MDVGGRYKIGGLLAESRTGAAYTGTDMHTSEPVAMKILDPQWVSKSLTARDRFIRESESLHDLNHPHIVKVHGLYYRGEGLCIVMDYVEGQSLRQILNKTPQLPVGRVLQIGLALADALTRAHYLRILHRDIKPGSVLIAEDGTALLSDFGVTQMLAPGSTYAATPAYLSPEAARGEELTARSDIWSFGVLLFEMLAGRLPFEGEDDAEIVDAIRMQHVPDLEALRPDAPVALVDLVYRMLAKQPEARIPGARQVGAEIEAILAETEPAQNAAVGASFSTPAIALGAPNHNLPQQTTPFVGREDEIADLAGMLSDEAVSLITLCAPGGMGKTRLALETAHGQLLRFRDGAYWVPLAPLDSAHLIVSAVAEAVGFESYQGSEPRRRLLDYLRDKRMLLVLDNFEHLLKGVDFVAEILAYAPGVKILVTSRETLDLDEEAVYRLGGLPVPDGGDPADYDAVRLFVASARRARPGCELEEDDLAHIARILQLVDGMPLGIELAAAWVGMMPLDEIANRIAESFDFLETQSPDVDERHRSLRTVFETTWDRLPQPERDAFMRLSVFRGGFTREAAARVAGAGLRTLLNLVNRALLDRDESGRFHIHELLRQFGAEMLEASGQSGISHGMHCTYYADYMRRRAADLRGPLQLKILREIEADLENARAAWEWAVTHKDYAGLNGLADLLDMEGFYLLRNRIREAEEMLGHAVQAAEGEEPSLLWARLLTLHTYFYYEADIRFRADTAPVKARLREAMEVAKAHDERPYEADCVYLLGYVAIDDGDFEGALAHFQTALEIYEMLDVPLRVAVTLYQIGNTHHGLGHSDDAIAHYERSIALAREMGDKRGRAWPLFAMAGERRAQGEIAEAEQLYHDAKSIFYELGDHDGIVPINNLLAFIALDRGHIAELRALGREMVETVERYNIQTWGRASGLYFLGMAANLEGSPETAVKRCTESLEASELDWARHNAQLGLSYAYCAMGDDARAHELNRSLLREALETGDTFNLLHSLPVTAVLAARAGDSERAAELLALFLMQADFPTDGLEMWPPLAHLHADLEAHMPAAAFMRVWGRGRSLDLEATIREMLA